MWMLILLLKIVICIHASIVYNKVPSLLQ